MDEKTKFYTFLAISTAIGLGLAAIVYSRFETVIYFWQCTAAIRVCNLVNAGIFIAISTTAAMGLLYFFDSVIQRIRGHQKKVNLRLEEFPQNMGFVPHLSLKIYNHELFDIESCYGTLLELEHLYTPTVTLPILETVNPNNKSLSWGGGSETEYVTIPRSDGKNPGVKILNIANCMGNDVVFLFHGHEHKYHGGNYRAKIKIDGKVGDTPIKAVTKEFCFKFGPTVYTSRNREPEIGEKQKIIIVASQGKSSFAFEDCDKMWETSMSEMENE